LRWSGASGASSRISASRSPAAGAFFADAGPGRADMIDMTVKHRQRIFTTLPFQQGDDAYQVRW
jgi:hypothetical protein